MSKEAGKHQLRAFGLIVGTSFIIIGLVPVVLRGQPAKIWALAVGLVLASAALVLPTTLGPAHRAWMQLAEVLGWVNTRIILFLIYSAVIVPIGWVLRMTGKDLLRVKLEPEAKSYRIVRNKRAASHMQHQY